MFGANVFKQVAKLLFRRVGRVRTEHENEATRYAVTIMLIETKPQKDVVAQAAVRFFAFTTKRFQRVEKQ